jgi:hypothetical protein
MDVLRVVQAEVAKSFCCGSKWLSETTIVEDAAALFRPHN